MMQVGFMFDGALPKTRRSFRFGDVSAAVRLVDDDPGAVQVMGTAVPTWLRRLGAPPSLHQYRNQYTKRSIG